MAVRDVLLLGNPLIREKSRPVIEFAAGLAAIIADLRDTLHAKQFETSMGRAIAAPQIGEMIRLVCVEMPERCFVLVNPEIVRSGSEMFEVWDGCFSFAMAFFVLVPRHRRIIVRFQDETGRQWVEEFVDDMAELLQHEIDHLQGILAVDRMRNPGQIMMRAEYEKRIRSR